MEPKQVHLEDKAMIYGESQEQEAACLLKNQELISIRHACVRQGNP